MGFTVDYDKSADIYTAKVLRGNEDCGLLHGG